MPKVMFTLLSLQFSILSNEFKRRRTLPNFGSIWRNDTHKNNKDEHSKLYFKGIPTITDHCFGPGTGFSAGVHFKRQRIPIPPIITQCYIYFQPWNANNLCHGYEKLQIRSLYRFGSKQVLSYLKYPLYKNSIK